MSLNLIFGKIEMLFDFDFVLDIFNDEFGG